MARYKTKKYDDIKVMTPPGRLSFPALFKMRAFENQEPKYSCMLIFDNDADLKEMKLKAKKLATEYFGGKIPKNAKSPFRDHEDMCSGATDPSMYDGFEGCTFVRFSSTKPIGIVDENAEDVIDQNEAYPGRWARVVAVPFCYDVTGNKGVAFGLRSVQLLDHDERIDGGGTCKSDFEPVEIKGKKPVNDDDDDGDDDCGW